MTATQRRILATTLALTALFLLAYTVAAATILGFSFGSFALYGLFPMLAVYFGGMALFLKAGKTRT